MFLVHVVAGQNRRKNLPEYLRLFRVALQINPWQFFKSKQQTKHLRFNLKNQGALAKRVIEPGFWLREKIDFCLVIIQARLLIDSLLISWPMITLDDIPRESLTFKFIHASGPGGQHVNKASTAVELSIDLNSLGQPSGLINRLKLKNPSRVNKRGYLVLQVDNFRSQHRNRKQALEQFLEILNDAAKVPKRRIATSPTRSSKKKRLVKKKQRSVTKSNRKAPSFD